LLDLLVLTGVGLACGLAGLTLGVARTDVRGRGRAVSTVMVPALL
jgi:hypothetical protein